MIKEYPYIAKWNGYYKMIKKLLKDAAEFYCKVRLVLQSMAVITKWDITPVWKLLKSKQTLSDIQTWPLRVHSELLTFFKQFNRISFTDCYIRFNFWKPRLEMLF